MTAAIALNLPALRGFGQRCRRTSSARMRGRERAVDSALDPPVRRVKYPLSALKRAPSKQREHDIQRPVAGREALAPRAVRAFDLGREWCR